MQAPPPPCVAHPAPSPGACAAPGIDMGMLGSHMRAPSDPQAPQYGPAAIAAAMGLEDATNEDLQLLSGC